MVPGKDLSESYRLARVFGLSQEKKSFIVWPGCARSTPATNCTVKTQLSTRWMLLMIILNSSVCHGMWKASATITTTWNILVTYPNLTSSSSVKPRPSSVTLASSLDPSWVSTPFSWTVKKSITPNLLLNAQGLWWHYDHVEDWAWSICDPSSNLLSSFPSNPHRYSRIYTIDSYCSLSTNLRQRLRFCNCALRSWCLPRWNCCLL